MLQRKLTKGNKKIHGLCDIEKLSDLLKIDPQKQIVKYLISEREKGLSFNSIKLNLHTIYHFYEMNVRIYGYV